MHFFFDFFFFYRKLRGPDWICIKLACKDNGQSIQSQIVKSWRGTPQQTCSCNCSKRKKKESINSGGPCRDVLNCKTSDNNYPYEKKPSVCIKCFYRKFRSRPSFPFALYCMTNFQRLDWQALFQLENESALWSHLSSSKKKKKNEAEKNLSVTSRIRRRKTEKEKQGRLLDL